MFPWLQRRGCLVPGKILAREQVRKKMFPGAGACMPILFCRIAECKAAPFEISGFIYLFICLILVGGR